MKKCKLMNKSQRVFFNIFIRYVILVALALPDLYLFYALFTPLTVYPLYLLFSIFSNPSLSGNIIYIGCVPLEIIQSCVAGAAYYLLLILNLSTPNIQFKKRLKVMLLSFTALLMLNILRIFILGLLYLNGFDWFDVAHKVFWYTGSIIFVVLIWFAGVKIFKIKDIPIYSDIKFLLKQIKPKRSKKKH